MHVQPAEAAREGLVVFPVDVLVVEHEHLPVEPRVMDVLRLFVREGPRKIEVAHLGADVGCQRVDLECPVLGPNLPRVLLTVAGVEHGVLLI